MGKKKIIMVVGGIAVLAGGAAAAALTLSENGRSHHVEAARLQAGIARQLPSGWSDTVAVHGGTVTINLIHEGGLKETIRSMRAHDIVNADRPEMMKLLPRDAMDAEYVFQYFDTEDKGVQVRAAAGKGHHSSHPDLRFISREFINAQIQLASDEPDR